MILGNISLRNDKYMDKLNKQDNYVSNSRNRGLYLEVIPYESSFKLFLIRKTPIVNPYTQNVVGISGQINNLVWPNTLKTLFKLKGVKGLLINHKSSKSPLEEYPINNVQHMVLFLCLNNYSYTEIALLMNECGYSITSIRVNDYLEQLKLIFHVKTKPQLIEKAIGLNFHTLLPCDLFNNLNSISMNQESVEIVCCDCKLNNCQVHKRVS